MSVFNVFAWSAPPGGMSLLEVWLYALIGVEIPLLVFAVGLTVKMWMEARRENG